MIRVVLPSPLRALAQAEPEVHFDLAGHVTLRMVLDAVEARFPTLRGTIRDHGTHKRRAFVRFYVCEQDWSHESPDTVLPDRIRDGHDPVLIVGAMAGG